MCRAWLYVKTVWSHCVVHYRDLTKFAADLNGCHRKSFS